MDTQIAGSGYRTLPVGIGLALAAAGLILWPEEAMAAMTRSMALCANVVVPSLFPFFVLSSLVVELGLARYLGRLLEPVMATLFRVNGSCAAALALGVVGGYPVGARTAIALYQNGQCSRSETERLLAFCNNCGPAFILGVVGTGIFGSSWVGMLLYLIHLTASLLVGILFRFYKPHDAPILRRVDPTRFQTVSISGAFTRAVTGAMQAALNICAFVMVFGAALGLLAKSGALDLAAGVLATILSPLGLTHPQAVQLLSGLLEMTAGVSALTDGTLTGRMSMAAFLLGWAGLSVHCQVMSFLGDSGLSPATYLCGKALHGLFSALLLGLTVRFLPIELPAALYLAEQTETLAQLEFHRALAISATVAWVTWLLFLLLAAHAVKKRSRKRLRSVL